MKPLSSFPLFTLCALLAAGTVRAEPASVLPGPAPDMAAGHAPDTALTAPPPPLPEETLNADEPTASGGIAALFGDPASARAKPFRSNLRKEETNEDELSPELKKIHDVAARFYTASCEANDGTACLGAALAALTGKGMDKDYFKARGYFQKGCSLGNVTACHVIGTMYETGAGLRQNYVKAREFYDYACASGLGEGCEALGALYERGKGTGRNFAKAKELYGKACDLQAQEGCSAFKRLSN